MLFPIATQSMRGLSISIMEEARGPGLPNPMLANSDYKIW
jgi:hypothetical protein